MTCFASQVAEKRLVDGEAAILYQACPNYARSGGRQPAAPPAAVRKGFAFPWRVCPEQLPPRRLEGSAFQPSRRRGRMQHGPESQRLSAQQAAEPRSALE